MHINKYDHDTYCLENWNKNIEEAKSINDLMILIKCSGILSIDRANKKLIKYIINIFNDYSDSSDFDKLIENIQLICSKIKSNFESKIQFMERYKLLGQELQKSEELKICELMNNLKLEEKGVSKFKVEILTLLLKHISITDYKLINTEDHINNLLLNASTKAEIEWLIYKTKYHEIDEDHTNFIDLVLNFSHELDKTTSKKKQLEVISKGTTSLYEYAQKHFENEEKIMDENPNLHEIDEHKLKHKEILDILLQIKYYIDNQKVNIFSILRSKILNIWIHHTNTMDQITFNS